RIPRELSVEVGVDVDEPGGDHAVGGIDHPFGVAVDVAHGHDHTVGDADVAHPGLGTGPVDDRPVADEKVEHQIPLCVRPPDDAGSRASYGGRMGQGGASGPRRRRAFAAALVSVLLASCAGTDGGGSASDRHGPAAGGPVQTSAGGPGGSTGSSAPN